MSGLQVVIREARPSDGDFLRELFYERKAEDFAGQELASDLVAGLIEMQFRAREQHYRRTFSCLREYVIEADGEPAGAFLLDRGEVLTLVDICIRRTMRGCGCGKAALESILREAKSLGKSVVLHVEHSNPARRLYERLGFMEVGRDAVQSEMKWTS